MTILAIDTSSLAASCALLRDEKLLAEFFLNTALTHSETLAPMVQAMLRGAHTAIEDVDAFAVSVGPGSFTGLRIGIASVKGLAMAAQKPCVAVSTLEGLAENVSAFHGPILALMDARRGQLYNAAFYCENGALRRVSEDAVLPAEEIALPTASGPVLLVGDGAELFRQSRKDADNLRVAPAGLLHQRAGSVALVARRLAAKGAMVNAGELAPCYLRLSQAERERLARLR